MIDAHQCRAVRNRWMMMRKRLAECCCQKLWVITVWCCRCRGGAHSGDNWQQLPSQIQRLHPNDAYVIYYVFFCNATQKGCTLSFMYIVVCVYASPRSITVQEGGKKERKKKGDCKKKKMCFTHQIFKHDSYIYIRNRINLINA